MSSTPLHTRRAWSFAPGAPATYNTGALQHGPLMDQPSTPQLADYAAARDHMVDGQVRPNKVIDPRVIRAMRSIPRERFVPPHLANLAYVDEDVALGRGRALMEPMVIARLVQLARVREGDRVLVVGAGSGYGTALLAACGGRVTALEEDEALLAIARRAGGRAAGGGAGGGRAMGRDPDRGRGPRDPARHRLAAQPHWRTAGYGAGAGQRQGGRARRAR